METVTVSAERLQNDAEARGMRATLFTADDILAAPSSRLDEIFAQAPGVSLFRRATSRTAHPTTQGVTLRGLGPNGAGRTLVLLDGVPQNDPFGGWVFWSSFSALAISGVNVIEGSSAGSFGNQALGGVIDIRTGGDDKVAAEARYGSFDSFEGWGRASADLNGAGLTVFGGAFDSDGPYLLAPSQRTAFDVPAASDAWQAGLALSLDLGERAKATLAVKGFGENRVNGMRLAANSLEAVDASLSLEGETAGGVAWRASAYYQDRDMTNSFASVVDGAAPEERQVLDQFAVPARGYGGAAAIRFPLGAGEIELGGDLRGVEGSTNEHFRNLGAGYTRLRNAGGESFFAGAFADYVWSSERLTLSAAARLDYWEIANGFIRETNLETSSVIRNETPADRHDWIASGRVGGVFQAVETVSFTAAAYSGFRVPTLNELFRPFRVRNDVTEANPNLRPERNTGFDIGVRISPNGTMSADLTYFRNWLKDGVGNLFVAAGPGNFPPAGFIPAGGVLRQRQNIDRIVADGLEFAAAYSPSEAWRLIGRYLFVDARVARAAAAPNLAGLQVAQSPKHQASIGAEWRPFEALKLYAGVRHQSGLWDDDLNSRRLDAFTAADLAADFAVSKGLELFVEAQNLFNARVVSALSEDGLATLAQPRLIMAGVRARY